MHNTSFRRIPNTIKTIICCDIHIAVLIYHNAIIRLIIYFTAFWRFLIKVYPSWVFDWLQSHHSFYIFVSMAVKFRCLVKNIAMKKAPMF